LRSGNTRSCGCLSKEVSAKLAAKLVKTKHGHAPLGNHSPTYVSWNCMLQRCSNPKATEYDCYGGRGISVCKRWKTFVNFLKDMGKRPACKSLDRINNDKGYYKSNCRWATVWEQAASQRH